MKRKLNIQTVVILVFISFAVILLIRTLLAYSPVLSAPGVQESLHLRSLPASQSAVELLAFKEVLADYQKAVRRFREEAENLEYDARALWQRWSQFVRPRNNFSGWINTEDKAAVVRRGWEEKRQSEIFSLFGHIETLNQRIDSTDSKIYASAAIWERLREASERSLFITAGELEKFRKELAALAKELTEEDARIVDLQEEYDALRPFVISHLNRISRTPVYLDSPWHSHYLSSGNPRPEFRYNFDENYRLYYEEGRTRIKK